MEKPFTPKFKQLNYIYIYFFLLKRDEASVVYTLNKPTNTRFCFIMVSLASFHQKSSFRDKRHPPALTGECLPNMQSQHSTLSTACCLSAEESHNCNFPSLHISASHKNENTALHTRTGVLLENDG